MNLDNHSSVAVGDMTEVHQDNSCPQLGQGDTVHNASDEVGVRQCKVGHVV